MNVFFSSEKYMDVIENVNLEFIRILSFQRYRWCGLR